MHIEFLQINVTVFLQNKEIMQLNYLANKD